jgi:hypothetical protein
MQEATRKETGAETGLGRPAWADRPSPLRAQFDAPFCPMCLSIYCLRRRRPPHRSNHSTDVIHQKTAAARWGREFDELVARINAGGGKEARGGLQAVGLGVFPSFIAAIFIDDVLRSLHHPYVVKKVQVCTRIEGCYVFQPSTSPFFWCRCRGASQFATFNLVLILLITNI